MSQYKRLVFIASIILAIFFVQTPSAQATNQFATCKVDLNLRKAPNTDSQIIQAMPKGSLVSILQIRSGWAKVLFLIEKDNSVTGWASSKYLEVYRPRKVRYLDEEEIEVEPTYTDFTLRIIDVNLKCKESFLDNSYDSCNVCIEYAIDSQYHGSQSPQVFVEFDVELESSGHDSLFPKRDSEYIHESHYINQSSTTGYAEVDFRFNSILDKVQRVKIRDVNGRITDVY
ncbi:SH3 domain-containing protein [uncultured Pseudodesulfovibrio sp.]|uniref:SH3 domain-containing protein n=1 Tax=uncultured Pseudodesulfovibrio sp. TaxID=2035858 RepID=UPI0029C9B078|nr:SH3 domain-containing protein [uncultured Pseudodesulfovibrio sp.]